MSTLLTPIPQKSWCVLPNISIGGSGNGTTDYQQFWLAIKQILTNHATYVDSWLDIHGAPVTAPTACTIGQSSNGTDYGAADYINSTSDITLVSVWNNAHTYFTLTFPGVCTGGELLIDLVSNGGTAKVQLASYEGYAGSVPDATHVGGFLFSQAGYSVNGTASRRPYDEKETQIFNRRSAVASITYLGALSSSSTWAGKIHCMRTSDGSCNRIVFCQNGVPIFFFVLDVPDTPFHTNADPDTVWNGDSKPWFGAVYGSSTVVSSMLYNSTPGWLTGSVNFGTTVASSINPTNNTKANLHPVAPYCAFLGDFLIAANATAPNIGDGGYVPTPLGLAVVGSYMQPWTGGVFDLYCAGNNLADGSRAEDVSSSGYSWVKLGNFLLPWCRAAIELS